MVFLCFRKCSKTKRIAVYEPELIEKNSTLVENPGNEFKDNTSDERKISIDQYSHYFIDEYASGPFFILMSQTTSVILHQVKT